MRYTLLILTATACAAFVPAKAVQAACFEDVGCTDSQKMSTASLRRLSCDNLWMVRNAIYHENGYCFQTARGQDNFSNVGCLTSNQSAIKLNSYERANVQAVRKVEKEKGCR